VDPFVFEPILAGGKSAPRGIRLMTKTPVSLLERLRGPCEPEAWTRFVTLYTPVIYSWARRVGLQDQDAADLVQDVLVTLIQAMPKFNYDHQRSFGRWLRMVTLNKWRDRNKLRAAQVIPGSPVGLAEVPDREDPDAFGEAEYRQHLVGQALRIMQADFQPTTWKACWEHGVCGRPAPAVAKELRLSTGAVYAATFRVLDRLRQELGDMLD
jgi:RNA polymerase sigma-70 factor, ECF subfamily